jgi:tetraacyldisaccharide 4'-kinase
MVLATPLSWLVAWVAQRRRLERIRRATPPGRPLVVVGNLVVGGAGKTPATIAIVRGLRARGLRVGVICGAYRASDPGPHAIDAAARAAVVGDEAVLIARSTAAPTFSGRDRGAALHALLNAHPEVEVVVSDDGLQSVGLPRTLELAVFDARGAGNGRVLPAGPLREPLATAADVDALLLNAAPAPIPHRRQFQFRVRPTGLRPFGAPAGQPPITGDAFRALLGERPLLAVAGIAQPGRLFDSLRALGLAFEPRSLPDHAPYDPSILAGDPRRWIVTTEKDAVKWPSDVDARCWVLVVEAEFEPPFFDWLEERIRGQAPA